MAAWIVLLEAEVEARGSIDHPTVSQLLASVDGGVVALHNEDRCAVQLEVKATDQADAVHLALRRWHDASSRSGRHLWRLVRIEVLTPEELARELDAHGGEPPAATCGAHAGRQPGVGEGAAEDLLRRLFSDPSTGLASGEVFQSRLEHVTAEGAPSAVVCMELDPAPLGGARSSGRTGEQFLVTVAERLAGAVRAADTVARLGELEFGMIIENVCEQTAGAIVERVLDGASRPVSLGDKEILPGVSAGMALTYPGDSAEAVIGHADAALASARRPGGHRYEFFRRAARWPTTTPRHFRVKQVQDRLGYLVLIQTVTATTNNAETLEEAAQLVMRHTCTLTGCVVGRLHVIDEARPGELRATSVWHLPASGRYRLGAGTEPEGFLSNHRLLREVVAGGQPRYVADRATDPDGGTLEASTQPGLRGSLAVPVLVGREVVAVLEFFATEPIEPEPSLIEVLSAVGTQLGRVVERTRAREARQLPRAAPEEETPAYGLIPLPGVEP